jgi:hypothetical protein
MRVCAYQLFRNQLRPQLFCATPEDRPVPGFLGPEHWSFECLLHPWEIAPPGFREQAAAAGVRLNGFYLFHLLREGAALSVV